MVRISPFFSNCFVCLRDKVTEREGETHRKICLLTYSRNGCTEQGRAQLNPQMLNSVHVSNIYCRGPSTWSILYCLPGSLTWSCMGREAARNLTGPQRGVPESPAAASSAEPQHWPHIGLLFILFYLLHTRRQQLPLPSLFCKMVGLWCRGEESMNWSRRNPCAIIIDCDPEPIIQKHYILYLTEL